MNRFVQIDELRVEVRRSPRRRTVDLIVDRFGDLVINVPDALPARDVEAIVRKKQEWIYSKLGDKKITLYRGGPKEYVTGEGFHYLGKKYRLKVFDPEVTGRVVPPLRLLNGRFMMFRSAAIEGRDHFIRWYTNQALKWLKSAVDSLQERVGAKPRSIYVRDLKYRWGSCNAGGDAYFHWRVILLPPKMVRYLVIHELVHLHVHNHSLAFYERLARVAPDYREIEAWLKENGDHYALYEAGRT
jgi:predicted metal-dependent hydrolase